MPSGEAPTLPRTLRWAGLACRRPCSAAQPQPQPRPDHQVGLHRSDQQVHAAQTCRLEPGAAVLYDTEEHGYRTGVVTSIAATGYKVTLDEIHLYRRQGGKLPAVNITVTNRDDLLKAPLPASRWTPKLKAGDWVRVANDDIGGQVWQYGKVGYVYNDQLVDITYDGTEEVSHHIPTFDVQRAS